MAQRKSQIDILRRTLTNAEPKQVWCCLYTFAIVYALWIVRVFKDFNGNWCLLITVEFRQNDKCCVWKSLLFFSYRRLIHDSTSNPKHFALVGIFLSFVFFCWNCHLFFAFMELAVLRCSFFPSPLNTLIYACLNAVHVFKRFLFSYPFSIVFKSLFLCVFIYILLIQCCEWVLLQIIWSFYCFSLLLRKNNTLLLGFIVIYLSNFSTEYCNSGRMLNATRTMKVTNEEKKEKPGRALLCCFCLLDVHTFGTMLMLLTVKKWNDKSGQTKRI